MRQRSHISTSLKADTNLKDGRFDGQHEEAEPEKEINGKSVSSDVVR